MDCLLKLVDEHFTQSHTHTRKHTLWHNEWLFRREEEEAEAEDVDQAADRERERERQESEKKKSCRRFGWLPRVSRAKG